MPYFSPVAIATTLSQPRVLNETAVVGCRARNPTSCNLFQIVWMATDATQTIQLLPPYKGNP